MSKLHYCVNGRSVTDQVILYQQTGTNEDYMPIQWYYDCYKKMWYKQIQDYMDRESFNSEFNFRLVKSVKCFDAVRAQELVDERGWNHLGMFNRWFYHIMTNWKSNVKTSSYRVKKRPTVGCPICGKQVGRIDARHLQHIKTTKDLPRFFTYKGMIYQLNLTPGEHACCYGKYGKNKLKNLNDGKSKDYAKERCKVDWPFFDDDGLKGVVCPLTKKVVSNITDDYILLLPDNINRYAQPHTWEEFIENYPSNTLIQSEIYSLDFAETDDVFLGDSIERDCRNVGGDVSIELVDSIIQSKSPESVGSKYEHIFFWIDQNFQDDEIQQVLKLIAIGFTVDDVADTLSMEKTDVKKRIRSARDSDGDLEVSLLNIV